MARRHATPHPPAATEATAPAPTKHTGQTPDGQEATLRTLAWLAEDLRLEDNPALALVRRHGGAAVRIEPEARGRPPRTAGRRQVEDLATARLADALGQAGIPLEVLGPADDPSIERTRRRHGCTGVVRIAHAGTPLEAAYLAEAEDELRRSATPVTVLDDEVVPATNGADRTNRRDRDHPMERLTAFLDSLPTRGYRDGMWRPGPDRGASSLLSTELACGTLSGARATAETARAERTWLRRHPDAAGSPEAQSFRSFAARLGWRRGFIAAFARPGGEDPPAILAKTVQAGMARWLGGHTGVPMIDAAMRELAATGWANFRMRQMAASFATMSLGLPHRDVALALAGLFDDYEPAITWIQVGIHAGILGRERGPRIVNPVKQGRELDQDETYVRRWIPELRTLPAGFGHEPWRHPESPLGPPIVDHLAAARTARATFPGQATARDKAVRLPL